MLWLIPEQDKLEQQSDIKMYKILDITISKHDKLLMQNSFHLVSWWPRDLNSFNWCRFVYKKYEVCWSAAEWSKTFYYHSAYSSSTNLPLLWALWFYSLSANHCILCLLCYFLRSWEIVFVPSNRWCSIQTDLIPNQNPAGFSRWYHGHWKELEYILFCSSGSVCEDYTLLYIWDGYIFMNFISKCWPQMSVYQL